MSQHRTNAAANTSDRKLPFLLILDRDADTLSYLSKLLQRFDYRVFTSASAREALDVLTTTVPSLIIVARDLKDMDGLKFMQTIKKTRELSAVPFIALTRQGDLAEVTRGFEAGAVDCLEKPVSAEVLYRAVQTIVEKTPRTNVRVRTLLPVKITSTQYEGPDRTCALDVSENGVFIASEKPADINTRLSLLINLNGQLIPVEAVVLRSDRTGEGPYQQTGMGLKFVRINPRDQEAIRQYIMDDVTRGIEPKKA